MEPHRPESPIQPPEGPASPARPQVGSIRPRSASAANIAAGLASVVKKQRGRKAVATTARTDPTRNVTVAMLASMSTPTLELLYNHAISHPNVHPANGGRCRYYIKQNGSVDPYPKLSWVIPGYENWHSVNYTPHQVAAILAFRDFCPEATIADQVAMAETGRMHASHRCRTVSVRRMFSFLRRSKTMTVVKETSCLLREHLIWETDDENDARKQCTGQNCCHHPACIVV